jgi:hypothetical protein
LAKPRIFMTFWSQYQPEYGSRNDLAAWSA